jgi:hypothetical protein
LVDWFIFRGDTVTYDVKCVVTSCESLISRELRADVESTIVSIEGNR